MIKEELIMKRTLKGTYKDKKPIGCYTICNSAGLLFYEPDFEDAINGCDYVVGFINGSIDNPGNKFSQHKVFYTLSGRPYINKLSQKIYLSDVMKLD
jgi:hypothetical protein